MVMITTRHVLGWILATALVTLAAWWVVAAASGEVNEVSAAPVVVPTTSTSTGTGSSSSLPSTSTSLAPSSTVSSDATTSTSTPDGSSSTTVAAASGVETISSAGGTVTVSYGNGQVQLQGASPAFGYSMEIEKIGPDEVRVDFESDNNDISVRVEWENGKLDIEIND